MMLLFQVLTVLCAIVAVAFPVNYALSDWTRTLPGRSTMAMSCVVAVVMVLVALRAFGILLPDWSRFLVYGGILTVLSAQLAVLLRLQYGRTVNDGRRFMADRDGTRLDHERID